MDEPIRQDRRYKWFRPRQAALGFANPSGTGPLAAALYNNSTGAQLIVIRSVQWGEGGGFAGGFAMQLIHGTNGTLVGPGVPFITGDNIPAGRIYANNGPVTITPQMSWSAFSSGIVTTLPIAILQPGWSAVFSDINSSGAVSADVGFLWEAIEPDELDYLAF